jgi:hypothetical protein
MTPACSPRAARLACTRARLLRTALCMLCFNAPLAAAEPARQPQPPARLSLDYVRGPGARDCMTPEALTRAVEERLGRRVFVAAGAADLRAKLRAERTARGFGIEVELFDGAQRSLGRRQLHTRARQCSSLDDSLALVVSLAADVSLAAAAPESVAPAASIESALSSPIEIPAYTVAPRAPWRLRPSLGVAALGGLLPTLGWGLAVELELTPPRFWPLFVRATGWWPQRIGSSAAHAEFSAQNVELGVCPWTLPLGQRLASRSCAEQLIGRLSTDGSGFDRAEPPGAKTTFAMGASETLSIRLGDWFVSVSGSLLVPLIQRRYFYVDGTEITLHDQGWLWGSGSLSVGFEL